MKVNLLLNPANRSWIIQKIAENLAEHLLPLDVQASITDTVDETAHLVHHMSWAFANIGTRQPSTMLITHLDDVYKMNQVKTTLASHVDVGICMSSDTMRQLMDHGTPAPSLYFISPAHDGMIVPRRTVIGITSRVYADGRKREALLKGLAKRMRLEGFEFRIFGLGWEPTIQELELAGAKVIYFGESDDFRKDYVTIQTEIPKFDYYLYLGMDEGSLGTLDALSAGVATIVSPQGFHLDLPGGITHPVLSLDDLEQVFSAIDAERLSRVRAVEGLTWASYASRHSAVWRAVVDGQPLPALPAIGPVSEAARSSMNAMRKKSLYANTLHPRRLVSAISHWTIMKSVRRAVDKIRLGR